MKTLTEFVAVTLKTAAKTRAELTSSGKTIEELPAAMGEALKLEGDKLTFIMNALEAVGNKTEDLKRVIVSGLLEGEKAPSGVKQIGDHFYAIEYYPSLTPKRAPQGGRDDRDSRGGKRGDKRGGGGDKRGDKRPGGGGGKPGAKPGERNDRGEARTGDRPRGPRPERTGPPQLPRMGGGVIIAAVPAAGITTVSFENPNKRPRAPKQPRPQGRSGLELPKPKIASSAPIPSAPESAAPAAEDSAKTE